MNTNNMIIKELKKFLKKIEEKHFVIDNDKIPITTDIRGLGTWNFQEMFINI